MNFYLSGTKLLSIYELSEFLIVRFSLNFFLHSSNVSSKAFAATFP